MELATSPHVKRRAGVVEIMKNVVFALIPVILYAIYVFGISVILVLLTTTGFALLTEHYYNKFNNKKNTTRDYSAVITGLLLGLTLPPGFPLWMAAVGGIVSILLGKMAFGGLGFNPFNPALVGRAFLQTAFPSSITTWTDAFMANRFEHIPSTTLTFPFTKPVLAAADAASGATPLALMKFDKVASETTDLFLGSSAGSIGETSALLILLGGIYLAVRKMMDWRIPVSVLLSAFVFSGILYLFNSEFPTPWFMLLSGGMMLGAVFMASDMVSSPVTPLGVWIYGALIGIIVVVIRIWGGLPEGVMYAILLGNSITPLLNLKTKPKVYGTGQKA
jgi:electron transport complex protein RnfD